MDAGVELVFCGVFQNLAGVSQTRVSLNSASTLKQFFHRIEHLFPGILQAVVPDSASWEVSPDVLLILNGMPVRRVEDSITVQNGDRIIFMLMIAGG